MSSTSPVFVRLPGSNHYVQAGNITFIGPVIELNPTLRIVHTVIGEKGLQTSSAHDATYHTKELRDNEMENFMLKLGKHLPVIT